LAALSRNLTLLHREADPAAAIQSIITEIQSYLERRGGELVVDMDCVSNVVADMSRDEDDLARESIQLYSSFKLPKLRYEPMSKMFQFDTDPAKRTVVAAASSKIEMLRERWERALAASAVALLRLRSRCDPACRFQVLHQRLLRNPLFAPQIMGSSKETTVSITPIESVSSTDDTLLYLFGMLTLPEEGKFCLEDLRAKVMLDLSSAIMTQGMFTETSIVLVQGKYRSFDDVFEVQV
jgi:hypothetical protein